MRKGSLFSFLILALVFNFTFTTKAHSQSAVKKPVEIIQVELEIPIVINDKCLQGQNPMTGTVQILCAYSLGGKLPAGGKILESKLTEDAYFESKYWLAEGDKLVFEFLDYYGSTMEDFYSEIVERYKNFPVTYKAVYQGPDFEIDEDTIGKPVSPPLN